jgi:hypothetical protein
MVVGKVQGYDGSYGEAFGCTEKDVTKEEGAPFVKKYHRQQEMDLIEEEMSKGRYLKMGKMLERKKVNRTKHGCSVCNKTVVPDVVRKKLMIYMKKKNLNTIMEMKEITVV